MALLNRFPLLGLWAREAALRIGYSEAESDTLGHAYAVLYAIRANSPIRPGKYKDMDAKAAADKVKEENPAIDRLRFGDDELQISRDREGRLIGRVGDAEPQTPQSYRYKIVSKFPGDWYGKVQSAFRDFLSTYSRERLDSRALYTLYDSWKKSCASGRMVDLEKLVAWCRANKPKGEKSETGVFQEEMRLS